MYVLSRLQLQCLIVSMPPRHKEAPVGWASCRVLYYIYNNDRASSIWSFQWIQGGHLRRLPQITASNNRLAGASYSIWTTWPTQRSRWILIRCTTSMSWRSSYSSHYWIECRIHRQLALNRRSYIGIFSPIFSRLLHYYLWCPCLYVIKKHG